MATESEKHWDRLYRVKRAADLLWYESDPQRSVQSVRETGVPADAPILDVGGGGSLLVDDLLLLGYTDVTVLDLAPAALAQSRDGLGPASRKRDVDRGRRDGLSPDAPLRGLARSRVTAFSSGCPSAGAVCRGSPERAGTPGTRDPGGVRARRPDPVQRSPRAAVLGGAAFGAVWAGVRAAGSMLEDHPTPSGMTQQFLHTRWQVLA
jgi:hypothetical protein